METSWARANKNGVTRLIGRELGEMLAMRLTNLLFRNKYAATININETPGVAGLPG
jgi:hypothetical protein